VAWVWYGYVTSEIDVYVCLLMRRAILRERMHAAFVYFLLSFLLKLCTWYDLPSHTFMCFILFLIEEKERKNFLTILDTVSTISSSSLKGDKSRTSNQREPILCHVQYIINKQCISALKSIYATSLKKIWM
jgi:hypothetical protein